MTLKANFLSSRYQFFLAVKKDILDGKLDVPFDLSAQLFAYSLQCKFLLNLHFSRNIKFKM